MRLSKLPLSFPIGLGLSAILLVLMGILFESRKSRYLQTKINDLSVAYNIIFNAHLRVSQIIFDEVINQPEVLEIFSQARSPNPHVQDQARQDLLMELLPAYERLQEHDVKQLHFHLPNNVSFLRFHAVDTYGDDLTNIRASIRLANAKLVPMAGFEEGRVFNGFRYVFPVLKQGEHLGSAEVSVDFSLIKHELEEIFDKQYQLIINRQVVEDIVFDDHREKYYRISSLNDNYMTETRSGINPEVEAINQQLQPLVEKKLEQKEAFAMVVNTKQENVIAVFLPIANIENRKVAYIVAYEQDNTIRAYGYELITASVIGVIAVFTICILLDKYRQSYHLIKSQALVDSLTNIPNHRSFRNEFIRQYQLGKRNKQPLSLIMADVDNFKLLNDTYGHKQGDECLQKIAQAIQRSLQRSTDFCARYGGEEFIVVLPNTNLQGAMQVAETIRTNIEKLAIPNPKAYPSQIITLSLGVATLMEMDFTNQEDLIKHADAAMYQSKSEGRNQVHHFGDRGDRRL